MELNECVNLVNDHSNRGWIQGYFADLAKYTVLLDFMQEGT